MLKKTPLRGGQNYRVTFTLPPGSDARTAFVVGEFNDWERGVHPLLRRRGGQLSTSLTLKTGREYRFRYLLDGGRWENDPQADGYVPNPFGSQDSILRL